MAMVTAWVAHANVIMDGRGLTAIIVLKILHKSDYKPIVMKDRIIWNAVVMETA